MIAQDTIDIKSVSRRMKSHIAIPSREDMAITESGIRGVGGALVDQQAILETTRIDILACQSSFHPEKCKGKVPVNLSLFSEEDFRQAIELMRRTFKAGLCVSELVAVAHEGERLGDVILPQGKVGLMTISQIVIKGALLKAGIPVNSKFGGLIQVRNQEPLRFVDLIEYTSTSLDPSQVFIAAKMTSVNKATVEGSGKILAGFWEIPASALPKAAMFMERMEMRGIRGLLKLGKVGETLCETPVAMNKVGMVLADGLNPVAAAVEAGIEVINHAMIDVIDFRSLECLWDCKSLRR